MAIPTPYSYRQYQGDGVAKDFSVPFPYLDRTHVHVFLNSKELVDGTDYNWTSGTQLSLAVAPQAAVTGTAPKPAEVLTVRRLTPEGDQIVQWKDGSYIIQDDLNESDRQWLYLIQEHHDWLIRYQSNLPGLPGDGGNTGQASQFWNQLARHLDPAKGTASELAQTVDTKDQRAGDWLTDDRHVATAGAISERLDVIMSDTKPPDPPITEARQPGKFWVDTSLLQINYWEATARAWVNISMAGNPGPPGPGGPDVYFGPTPPGGTEKAWFSTDVGRLYLKFEDPDSTQWIDASPSIKGDKGDVGPPGPAGPPGTPAVLGAPPAAGAMPSVVGHAPITATAVGANIDLVFDPIPLSFLP